MSQPGLLICSNIENRKNILTNFIIDFVYCCQHDIFVFTICRLQAEQFTRSSTSESTLWYTWIQIDYCRNKVNPQQNFLSFKDKPLICYRTRKNFVWSISARAMFLDFTVFICIGRTHIVIDYCRIERYTRRLQPLC